MAEPTRGEPSSIKRRKNQLFEADEPVRSASKGETRTFQECLRTTPAAPLSSTVKAILYVTGAVVVLILVVALVKPAQPRKKPQASHPVSSLRTTLPA